MAGIWAVGCVCRAEVMAQRARVILGQPVDPEEEEPEEDEEEPDEEPDEEEPSEAGEPQRAPDAPPW